MTARITDSPDSASSRDAPGTFLLVTPWPLTAVGGVSRVTIDLYDQFHAKSALEPFVLINSWCHKKPSYQQQEGRNVVLLRVPHPWGASGGPLRKVFNIVYHSIPAITRIGRLLRRKNVKVIDVHYPSVASLLFLLAARFRRDRARMILSFHGSDVRTIRDASGMTLRAWRYLCNRVDAITTCSHYLKSDLCGALRMAHDRVDVVYHGIDLSPYGEVFVDWPDVLPAKLKDLKIILAIGKQRRSKGHDLLIQAFDRIASDFRDTVLVILGPSGDLSCDIEELAGNSPYRERIWLLPEASRKEIVAALSRSSVFVLPSRRESMGIVLLEAGHFGMPVVASRVGGIPEVIEHGTNGLLFDPEDVDGLTRCITRILVSPAEAAAMGTALRETVAKRFSLASTYRCMCELVEGQHPEMTT